MQDTLIAIWGDLKGKYPELEFIEKTHTYYIAGKKLPSVSTLLKSFYEDFDSETVSLKYSLKRNFDVQDVRDAWQGENDIANDKGHDIHLFGELYVQWKYFGIGTKPKCTSKQHLAIIEFWNDLPAHLVPVATELQMYSKALGYCGTADIIVYDLLNDCYWIMDYKTNKTLFNDNEKYPAKPLFHINPEFNLKQENYGKYALQFSFYQILLEEVGLKVGGRVLIYLQEKEDKLYQKFQTPDVTKDLRQWLATGFKKAA